MLNLGVTLCRCMSGCPFLMWFLLVDFYFGFRRPYSESSKWLIRIRHVHILISSLIQNNSLFASSWMFLLKHMLFTVLYDSVW